MLIFWDCLFGACRFCGSSPLTVTITYFGVFLHILLKSLTASVHVGVVNEQFNYGMLSMRLCYVWNLSLYVNGSNVSKDGG